MFENLFTTKTTTKKKVDFSNIFANKEVTSKTTTKKKVDFSNIFANKEATSKPRTFNLNESLGGGQFNVGNAGELVKTERGYAGIEAPGKYREHKFPIALGGTSNFDNIKVYGKDLGAKKSAYENNIIRQYKAGKVSLNEARGLVLKKYRELTGLDPKQGVLANLPSAIAETIFKPAKIYEEYKAKKQEKKLAEMDVKKQRGELLNYYEKSPEANIDGYNPDVKTMSDEQVRATYSSIFSRQSKEKEQIVDELITSALPTAARAPGEIIGRLSKAGTFEKKLEPVIDLREVEMIEPKKVGRITEQGFEPVNVEKTIADTADIIEAPKKELNLDAFKKSVKKQEPIVQEISKAKAEGNSFNNFIEQKLPDKEYATVYHRTNTSVDDFGKTPIYSKENKDEFFVSNRSDEQISGYGDNVIELRVKKKDLEINDEFPSGEEHYTINTKKVDEYLKTKSQLKQQWDTAEIKAPKVEKPITYKPIKEVVAEIPEIKTSKLALGVEEKAIAKKLTEGFEDLPEYAKVNVEQQARASKELVKNRLKEAIEIARGNRLPPEGILPESVFTAVEQYAIKNKDVGLLQDLARSNLTTEATGMGQRLRMLAERTPDAPATKIREAIENRIKFWEKKTGKKFEVTKNAEVKSIKNEIAKVKPKKDDWLSFAKSIEC